jgi:hypothetical protein
MTAAGKPDAARAGLQRALEGYDENFRRELAGKILEAIAEASRLEGSPPIMAIRTTETLDALADCLVMTLTAVPAMSVPSKLRAAAEALAKRVRREVARGRAGGVADILGANGMGGHA